MVLTLKETATRMTDLLQRLGRPDAAANIERMGLLLGPWARDLASGWAAGLGLVEIEGDISRNVRADADGLRRAIGHLVRNAIEASPAGHAVRVRLSENAVGASIRIIDRGGGMSEEFVRAQLFRPFSSTKATGFGLGAHEARLLVHGMGGTLDVESRPGEGSCFTIRLPFADMAGRSAPADPARKTA